MSIVTFMPLFEGFYKELVQKLKFPNNSTLKG